MTNNNDNNGNQGDDALVFIGALEVPLWQYNIYFNESEKFLLELEKEVTEVQSSGVSKALVRAIHTLAGISNTLGAEPVARLGYALEDWLTGIFDSRTSAKLTSAELALLHTSQQALSQMVECIRAKQAILDERYDILALLQQEAPSTSDTSPKVDVSEMKEEGAESTDWLTQEMKNLEASLSLDVDPNAGWATDLDELSSSLDNARAVVLGETSLELPTLPEITIAPAVVVISEENQPTLHDSSSTIDTLSFELEPEYIKFDIDLPELPELLSKTEELASHPSLDIDVSEQPTTIVASDIIRVEPVQSVNVSPPQVATAHELRDYRSYVLDLLPGDDVVDVPEESIKDIFIEEATEIFDSLPDDIDGWSASRGLDQDKSNKIKRALHTLKGSSRMSGYFRFGTVVHNIETVMETTHPVLSSSEIPDLVQAVNDALVQELEHIKDPSAPSGLLKASFAAAPSPVKQKTTEAVNLVMPEIHVEVPVTAINKVSTPVEIKTSPQAKSPAPQEDANINTVLRVPTEKIDILANQLGRSGTIQLRIETKVSNMDTQISEMSTNLERMHKLLKELEIQAETQMRSRMEEAKRDNVVFDPLEFDRFTRLQELTRMMAEAMHDVDNSHDEILRDLNVVHDSIAENNILAEDMQHAVMSVRTVPVKSLGRRLEMVIRQASLDTKKQAGLFLDSDVEVDSGILNKIVAPLEHLLRNAIAHGIEKPDVRRSLGKPEKGTVTLKVRLRGNDTVFKLIDDGAGINKAAVQKRARERGLIGKNDVLTQEQANQMIFEPGFSTADVVSELSGRGVGMDVVSDILSDMGGRIIVNSEEGKGSTFELVVPSYMSVISMVPVSARDVSYAVPSALVSDVIVVRDTKVLEAYETGHLEIHETSYPFYGLSEASGLEAPEIQRNNRIMLLDDQQGIAAIHIDNLEVDRNLVMKPLCRTIATLPGLLGASVAGDGTPLLVINPVQLRQSVSRQKRVNHRTAKETTGERMHGDMTVMVVDDSLTIRRITQKFLTRAGFKVVVAVDGLDAIEKIAKHGPADLYLTDIEMPHMDGFQLTEHIRTSVSKTTPIVMISSRSIEKYADHAKSLGVTRSLGKPYQEPELLAIIEELLGLKEANK